jgi:peptide/nickel transport system substrate-binding protein
VLASRAAQYSLDIGLMMQQFGQMIGLNLEIRQMPADGYWTKHWLNGPISFGNVNPRPTADAILAQFFKSDSVWNESRWKSKLFDDLLVASRAEFNVDRRKQMYADMQTMIHDHSGVGIPMFLSSMDGHSTKLKGLSPIPLGGLMGGSFAEHVWLDA